MDTLNSEIESTDLSALAWVNDELRRSLDTAHKALRRFRKQAESGSGSDIDAVDPAILRTARTQLHQGVGALEMVGLSPAAALLRASESALQQFIAKPGKLNDAAVDSIERASFALLDYLARLLANKPVSPLSFFPQYQAVQELAKADRIHPADLWAIEWDWRELPVDPDVPPRSPDNATRSALECHMLALMRTPAPHTFSRMSELFAGLAAGALASKTATLWQLASAVFEAQGAGLLRSDVYLKRMAARLLSQLRILESGGSDVSERLVQDLLFFCAHAGESASGQATPRLASTRVVWALKPNTVDYNNATLGKFDPALLVQASKRVVSAKEAWSAVAGGELHRLSGLGEQFALVADSLRKLFTEGGALAQEIQHAATQAIQGEVAPDPALAMEVATALLYVEACLEDGAVDAPEQGTRVRRLAERIASVRAGQAPSALESWMEALYRRVSDRQTMGSVVQELRASLSEVEKLVDQFFREASDSASLMPVPGLLTSMRGVLSVLSLDQASAAVVRMRDDVDSLMSSVGKPDAAVFNAPLFERLAANLGALDFLIGMLGMQQQMAKSLFVFDVTQGILTPVMGREASGISPTGHDMETLPTVEPRLIEQAQLLAMFAAREDVPLADLNSGLELLSQEARAAEQLNLVATVSRAKEALASAGNASEVASAREQLSEALVDFVSSLSEPVDLDDPLNRHFHTPEPVPTTEDLTEDAEMREIFLEEAKEVIIEGSVAVERLREALDDINLLTQLRRAFHTLKGSSRMVGLNVFGEAAWVGEQLYNARLGDHQPADEALITFTRWAFGHFSDWVSDIENRSDAQRTPAPVVEAARAVNVSEPAVVLESSIGSSPSLEDAGDFTKIDDRLSFDFSASRDGESVSGESGGDAGRPAATFQEAESESEELREAAGVDVVPSDEAAFDFAYSGLSPEVALTKFVSTAVLDLESGGLEPDVASPGFVSTAVLDLEYDGLSPDVASPGFDSMAIDERIDGAQMDVYVPLEPAGYNEDDQAEEDQLKLIGELKISIPLFNIYLNEADELSRRLSIAMSEWALESADHRISDETVALAHSLAGSSATVGFMGLSGLARALENAAMRSQAAGSGTSEEAELFPEVAEEIRNLLHQFAAGFLKDPSPNLLERLSTLELSSGRRLERMSAHVDLEALEGSAEVVTLSPPLEAANDEPPVDFRPSTAFAVLTLWDTPALAELAPMKAQLDFNASAVSASVDDDAADEDDIDAVDAVDEELFPIFEEEGQELLPMLATQIRDWAREPGSHGHGGACMRTLHTLKGGARLAGAMRLGEMAHRLESRIERMLGQAQVEVGDVEVLNARSDALTHAFEQLRARDQAAHTEAVALAEQGDKAGANPTEVVTLAEQDAMAGANPTEAVGLVEQDTKAGPDPAEPDGEPPTLPLTTPAADKVPVVVPLARAVNEIDWSHLGSNEGLSAPLQVMTKSGGAHSTVRVRAPLLDRLVNQAGEVSITRSRIASEVGQLRGSLNDLTDNLERLRLQLRDIELQGETQMASRIEAAKASDQSFDPLEFDRFTRFQELTRMMAESVNDVATVQRTLNRTLDSADDELAAQGRLTRELQDDLLRTRMVEFDSLSDRLYRVVRQASKETGKQVRLDIAGASIEIDRGVLDRMTGAFEHLLRNSVTHGIEMADERRAAGKDPVGTIVVTVAQEGNEVSVAFRDDGAGLDLDRIRAKATAMGLLDKQLSYSDDELANLIFTPGFSTAEKITELAGRGIGMDVVRSEVNAIGGRIETATASGQGTSFKLQLPLTTAVTQIVMFRVGETTLAVPSTMVDLIRRTSIESINQAYESGVYPFGERTVQFFWLGALLQLSPRSSETTGKTRYIAIIKSARQRIAVHVDEVFGNQEAVVKNLGPQLARLPGLAGMTLLASGAVALIYNPVALAALYGDTARQATQAASQQPLKTGPIKVETEGVVRLAPLVLVVDDSLTVRRVTQRLLAREGYRVTLAKDGLDALEKLAQEKPQIVLSDIEMPRMDGFDLVRNIRGDAGLRDLPVIMITSRIAQKHRDYAAELGVDHYLGKPYSEEDLLALIGRYTSAHAIA